ncbi:MAG: hypothetical protein NW237_05060 [Cyanobacteriota bacterium]|nr:hypothetical protein [Cyanobacteriota bacterium]
MATRKQQYTAYLPDDLSHALLQWQHQQGIPSTSAAIVRIVQTYLQTQGGSATTQPPLAPANACSESDLEKRLEAKIAVLQQEIADLRQAWREGQQGIPSDPPSQESMPSSLPIHLSTRDWVNPPTPPSPLVRPVVAAAPSSASGFQVGDLVRYYSRGRNLIERVLEVIPTVHGIDQLLLPSGRMTLSGPELDRFPSTMVVLYQES